MDVSVFTQRGGTISSVRRSLLHGEFRASRSPDIIVVHVGTNDLERGFFHSNIEQYRQLLVSVRELFPLAKVVVDGILPRYDSESLDTSRIYHNIGLGTLCAKVGCHFIDFSGDFDEWAYARDGLHLGWDGNALFGELLHIVPHEIIHNHEESDTQIWLHATETKCSTVHIYSLDRDIGMIGLPLHIENKTVVIQFKASSMDEKYFELGCLRSALLNDTDLAPLWKLGYDVPKIIQVLYIATGCDFVSYFARLGKSTFLKVFFQFAEFISGSSSPEMCGQLSFTNLNIDHKLGLLSFYRLVGCVYFQANRASLNQHASSPVELFNSIEASTVFEHHSKFLSIIRRASWQGVYEDTLLPSDTALSFHWLRSCWVSQVWGSALQPIFEYPDLKMYGWHYENDSNKVDVVWDSPTNMESVRRNVLHLTRGCACAKSKCVNRQCKCKKDNKVCGPGCTCRNCENLPLSSINLFSHDSSDDDSISFSSVSDEEFTDEVSPILHTLTEPTDHPSSDSSLEYEYEDLP